MSDHHCHFFLLLKFLILFVKVLFEVRKIKKLKQPSFQTFSSRREWLQSLETSCMWVKKSNEKGVTRTKQPVVLRWLKHKMVSKLDNTRQTCNRWSKKHWKGHHSECTSKPVRHLFRANDITCDQRNQQYKACLKETEGNSISRQASVTRSQGNKERT